MRPASMTPQRTYILRFILEYHNTHKFSPSQREIAEHVDSLRTEEDTSRTSTSAIRFHLMDLVKRGYLVGESRIARGYAPTEEGIQYIQELDHASEF